MPPPKQAQTACNEASVVLALLAIKNNTVQSARQAASAYNIPNSTLHYRRAGRPARRDCQPKSKKLTKLEEEVIVVHILELDSRGFAPTLSAVRDMANRLLTARDAGHIGIKWPNNFVKRQPELRVRLTRQQDRQRVLCEDPRVISPWFELVQRTREKYGILDEDIYNFDETGFMMGMISAQSVVTGSERRYRPKGIQPGNREWTTVIQGINAYGWAIPPFIVFAAKYHLHAWYEGNDIPQDWPIAVSEKGWTTNEIGVQWLEHFNAYTQGCTVGAYRLLIIDGHESHNSLTFQDLCKESKIITLCMPPHSSHLLQPLDVGCFSPLKRAYGDEISSLARNHINHIDKITFLPAFRRAFNQSITEINIRASFRGAGVVPYNPEAVLSKLDVKLRTPTPALPEATQWEAKTPSNARELEAQSALISSRIRRHKSSSPASIIHAMNQLNKGASAMAHRIALLEGEVKSLKKANYAATQRRQRSRKRIQLQGTLTKAQAADIIAQKGVDEQLNEETREGESRVSGSRQARARCRRCRGQGHNSRTCKTAV